MMDIWRGSDTSKIYCVITYLILKTNGLLVIIRPFKSKQLAHCRAPTFTYLLHQNPSEVAGTSRMFIMSLDCKTACKDYIVLWFQLCCHALYRNYFYDRVVFLKITKKARS